MHTKTQSFVVLCAPVFVSLCVCARARTCAGSCCRVSRAMRSGKRNPQIATATPPGQARSVHSPTLVQVSPRILLSQDLASTQHA